MTTLKNISLVALVLVSATLTGCLGAATAPQDDLTCASPELTEADPVNGDTTLEVAPELLEVYGCETFADMTSLSELSDFCASISDSEDGTLGSEPGPGCEWTEADGWLPCEWYWYCG